MYEKPQANDGRDTFFSTDEQDQLGARPPQFAPVVPIEVAKAMEEHTPGSMGTYHLLLAHDVLERPADYQDVYKDKGYTILMDNSLVELGYPLMVKDVLEAAKCVGAQFLILPDVLGDFERTITSTTAALMEWQKLSNEERAGIQLLPVIQGASHAEHMEFMFRFAGLSDIAGFCVPRVIADRCKTRKHIIQEVTKISRVHLLGFSENLWDDVACVRMPNVAGIDSAVPVRLGLQDRDLSFDDPRDTGPRGSYWANPFQFTDSLDDVVRNVELFRVAITA